MTFQILKSRIGNRDFAAECEAYKQSILDARERPGGVPMGVDQLVEGAVYRVRRDDDGPDDIVIDYEIVDDTPPPLPPPTREQRIQEAVNELRVKEQAEIEALIPSHKIRLMDMEFNRATNRITQAKVSGKQPVAADIKLVEDYTNLRTRISDIQYAYAQREAAIEEGE